jgi:hypothetical protein
MSVSILTVTQWARRDSLTILNNLIEDQTYSCILEWVIVEGSRSLEEREQNERFISTLTNMICPIRYIAAPGSSKLGALRQMANDVAVGDYRVVMDDDDYYPPERVSHAVQRLARSSKLLAGCSPMFMYDYGLHTLFQFKKFASNHSTSSCMAWKQDYDGVYDLEVGAGEEASFTRGFTEPMVQLDPLKTIVQSSHGTNTYSKRGLIDRYVGKTLDVVEADVKGYIPPVYLDRLCLAL